MKKTAKKQVKEAPKEKAGKPKLRRFFFPNVLTGTVIMARDLDHANEIVKEYITN